MTDHTLRFDLAHWNAYNTIRGTRPVRALCQQALALAGPGRRRIAVDIGAGAGIETAAMLTAGWRVTAIEPAADTALTAVPDADRPALAHRPAFVQDALPLPNADLVHASYALPFVPMADFDRVWTAVQEALLPGGYLAVTLFGPNDAWAHDPSIAPGRLTFHSRADVERLLDGLDIVDLDEKDREDRTTRGTKHWHVFEAIARRAK